MSGWIKLEKDRRDDPRVLRMARELRHAGVTHERFTQNAHVTIILGCLDVLWSYADTHVREDDTLDLGVDEIDELVGLKGFCGILPTDWLEVLDAKRVKLPDFHAHNGTESKKKALNQKRQERHRNAESLKVVTQESRKSVTPALPDQDQTKTIKDMAAKRPSVGQFGKFWEAYPKKVKKKDAEKVWQSKRLDSMADVLIADVKRRQSEDRRWLGGFICDPPVYLRGERWNDAIEPATKNGNGQHAADAAAKERTQILDLASMFGMELEGDEEWTTFKARVERANARRLENLGRAQ